MITVRGFKFLFLIAILVFTGSVFAQQKSLSESEKYFTELKNYMQKIDEESENDLRDWQDYLSKIYDVPVNVVFPSGMSEEDKKAYFKSAALAFQYGKEAYGHRVPRNVSNILIRCSNPDYGTGAPPAAQGESRLEGRTMVVICPFGPTAGMTYVILHESVHQFENKIGQRWERWVTDKVLRTVPGLLEARKDSQGVERWYPARYELFEKSASASQPPKKTSVDNDGIRAENIDEFHRAVVQVIVETKISSTKTDVQYFSGVVFDPRGYISSVAHGFRDIKPDSKIIIRVSTGVGKNYDEYQGRLLAKSGSGMESSDPDASILKIEPKKDLYYIPPASPDYKPEIGQKVYSAGCPKATFPPSGFNCVIESVHFLNDPSIPTKINVSVAQKSGQSGGPLIDPTQGLFIGTNSGSDNQGHIYFISSFWKLIKKNNLPIRPQ